MRQVQINRNLILREDGKLFNVHTGEEFIPKSYCGSKISPYIQVRTNNKNWPLHQLVMKYFGPPKPGSEYEIDHKDRNKLNNNINNLRWVTKQENANNRKSSLPVGQRRCDMSFKEYYRQRQAERYKKYPEKIKEANKRYLDKKKEGA